MQALFAKVLGVILLLVGLLGFAMSSPLLGLFSVNPLHNVVHVVSGIVLLWAGFAMGGEHAKTANMVFGAVYLLVAILGFLGVLDGILGPAGMSMLADNVLHLLIGVVTLGVAFGASE